MPLPTIDVWACSADRGAAPKVVAEGVRARPPDFRGTIVHEEDGLVVIRVQDFSLPRPGDGTVYVVDGHGAFTESKRVEWLSFGHGRPRTLLSMTPV